MGPSYMSSCENKLFGDWYHYAYECVLQENAFFKRMRLPRIPSSLIVLNHINKKEFLSTPSFVVKNIIHVRVLGLEPRTSSLSVMRSNHLSYTRKHEREYNKTYKRCKKKEPSALFSKISMLLREV